MAQSQERKSIKFDNSMTTMEVIELMAEGNDDAKHIILQMIQEHEDTALVCLVHLDDMNIRGSQIVIGYNDFLEGNIQRFMQCAFLKDEKMIAAINAKETLHKAVPGGATLKRLGISEEKIMESD